MNTEQAVYRPDHELALADVTRLHLWCACGGLITALDHADLIVHAIRVHQELEEHRRWRARQDPPSFEVEVR